MKNKANKPTEKNNRKQTNKQTNKQKKGYKLFINSPILIDSVNLSQLYCP